MIELAGLLVAVLEGLAQGAAGRIGRKRRRTEAREDQDYLATLRHRELGLLDAQQRAREEISHTHALEQEAIRGLVTLESRRILARERQHADNSPFTYDLDHSRQIVEDRTADGRPVLLLTPFLNEAPVAPANQFGVALRRTWDSLPWSGDLERIDGLVRRPLHHSDIDLMLIRQTLSGLPVVLVHGEIQAGRRVWTSLIGWGLMPADPDAVVKVNLPRLAGPDPADSTLDQILAFQDELARLCGTVAGVLGDWYHLFRSGRRPRVHLSTDDPKIKQSLGAALAAAYETAGAQQELGLVGAHLGQARVLAESGLRDAAVAVVEKVLWMPGQPDPVSRRQIEDIGELVRSAGGDTRVLDLSRAGQRAIAEREAEFWVQ